MDNIKILKYYIAIIKNGSEVWVHKIHWFCFRGKYKLKIINDFLKTSHK